VGALSISGSAERLPGVQAIDRYDKEQTMQSTPSLLHPGTASASSAQTAKLTRALLICGIATGVLFFAAFFGIATGSQQGGATLTVVNLAFSVAVVLGWAWISTMAARFMRGLNG
jgi:hypothetical protein